MQEDEESGPRFDSMAAVVTDVCLKQIQNAACRCQQQASQGSLCACDGREWDVVAGDIRVANSGHRLLEMARHRWCPTARGEEGHDSQ